jgi:prepilin-type N-terminal cleavage/methylation domain-containing protein
MPLHSPRRAFSLIELLIVIAIIGVIVGLVVGVGRAVTANAKRQLTLDTIAILDTALAAYTEEHGGLPPLFVPYVPTGSNPPPATNWPMSDVRDMDRNVILATRPSGNQMVNSVGLFILEAQKYARVKAILDKIPARQITVFDPDNDNGAIAGQPALPTVIDAWGRPIRFVHPVLDAVIPSKLMTDLRINKDLATDSDIQQIRRDDQTDSDGGRCVGNRPYFYSAGEDGEVGFRSTGDRNADNIYTTPPKFPARP